MGRAKGGKNKRWSMEEKLKIVRRYFDERIGQNRLAAEEGISRGQLHSWISKYQEGGPESLKNMKKVGNRYSALHTSKSLSVEERQRLEILRLRIENERLKKGYTVKGVGADKEFVSLKDLNSK
jgi:transposase-like protein